MRPHTHTRHLRRTPRRLVRHTLPLALAAALAAPLANAQAPPPTTLPTGGFVCDSGCGSATITLPGGNTMNIAQTTPGAIIDWQSFSIGSAATVNFVQPATGVTLNRVVDSPSGAPPPLSQIFGGLNANGRVFLVNPSGVLFGAGSQVNVGGLVASALAISNADFNAGVSSGRFVFAGANGNVSNNGRIVVGDRGTVALLGNEANNDFAGTIVAPRGSIVMGSGNRIVLDFEGDGLTRISVDGDLIDGLVRNDGALTADGGNVTLAAVADTDGDGNAIVHTGTIRARSLENRQGRVLLAAPGDVEIRGGSIDVRGDDAGEHGGSITLHGGNVLIGEPDVTLLASTVDNPAHLDATGASGGGAIEARADNVLAVAASRGLDASATGNGNGGSLRLLGGNGARIFGDLRARGGASGGNGGLIETSGGGIDLRGIGIDANAPNGVAGTWLIDPFDVNITPGAVTGSLPSNPFDPVADSTIQDGDINAALNAGSSVRITTGSTGPDNAGDITFVSTRDASGFRLSPAIARTVGTAPLTFQLDANRSITGVEVNPDGSVDPAGFSIDAGDGPLHVLFNANANNTAVPTSNDAGIVLTEVDIRTNGGDVFFYGQSDPVNGFAGGEEEGIDLLDTSIDTRGVGGGGEVRMRGRGGDSGVELTLTGVRSGAGDINLFGATVFSGIGVNLTNASDGRSNRLESGEGNISITGLALQSFPGSGQIGVRISDSTIATVSGTIDIFGRAQGTNGGTGPASAVGIELDNTAEITSVNGSRIRLAGESTLAEPFSPAFGAGINITTTCGNGGACIDGGSVGQVVLQAGNTGASDALILDGTVQTAGAVNLRPGGVDASGVPYDRVNDAIGVGSTGNGFAISVDEIGRITSPNLIFGSNTHAGAINVIAAITRAGNLGLHNTGGAGGIALTAPINVGANTLALVSGGAVTQTAAGAITAGSLLARSTDGNVALSTASNNVSGSTLAGDAAGDFSYTDVDVLTIGNVNAFGFDAAGNTPQVLGGSGVAGNNVFVRNLAGDMSLSAGASAGNNLDLVTAGRLQNSAAAGLSAGNRWRVWADTWIGETRGGLAGSGPLPNLYNCSFAAACGVTVPAADDHFIYRQQPTATITIADALREYGLANPAFTFSVAGMILGDDAANAISGAPGTTATLLSNVGDYAISGSFASPAGYAIDLLPGTLTIDPATLTYIADPFTRLYGDPNGVLGGAVAGFRNDDTLADLSGALSFATDVTELSDVGRYAINGGGLGALNYVFAQAPGNATALAITPATLTYVADPFTHFFGQPLGPFTGTVAGFRNGDTVAGDTTGTLQFLADAVPGSPAGVYPIFGTGLEALNYTFVQDPANLTALRINLAPIATAFDLVRESTDTYLYDRNIGTAQICLATDLLGDRREQDGDALAREWSKVRSRPNLTSCVRTDRKNGCGDF